MAFLIIYIDFFWFLMVVVHIYRNLQKMHFLVNSKSKIAIEYGLTFLFYAHRNW